MREAGIEHRPPPPTPYPHPFDSFQLLICFYFNTLIKYTTRVNSSTPPPPTPAKKKNAELQLCIWLLCSSEKFALHLTVLTCSKNATSFCKHTTQVNLHHIVVRSNGAGIFT